MGIGLFPFFDYFCKSSHEGMLIDLREREREREQERERERETEKGEKYQSERETSAGCLSHAPQLGSEVST